MENNKSQITAASSNIEELNQIVEIYKNRDGMLDEMLRQVYQEHKNLFGKIWSVRFFYDSIIFILMID